MAAGDRIRRQRWSERTRSPEAGLRNDVTVGCGWRGDQPWIELPPIRRTGLPVGGHSVSVPATPASGSRDRRRDADRLLSPGPARRLGSSHPVWGVRRSLTRRPRCSASHAAVRTHVDRRPPLVIQTGMRASARAGEPSVARTDATRSLRPASGVPRSWMWARSAHRVDTRWGRCGQHVLARGGRIRSGSPAGSIYLPRGSTSSPYQWIAVAPKIARSASGDSTSRRSRASRAAETT